MKLDLYKINVMLAERGKSMSELSFDYRWITRAKKGGNTRPLTVYKIADKLGVSPEEITIRE